MPRILVSSAAHILSDYLLTSEGTHCYELFKHMAKYGYEFEALSPYIQIHKPLANVTFHQVGSLMISPTSHTIHKYALHSEFLLRGLTKAKKLLREKKIDIIHHMLPAVFNYTFSPVALLTQNLRHPFVFGPLSAHYYERPLNERILLPLTSRLHKRTIQKSTRIITVTNQVRNLYTEWVDEEKISTIPFGVDTEVFKPAQGNEQQEEFGILYAGSLYALKGVPFLIRAMAYVRRNKIKANLTIVGEGSQKGALTALAKTLQIEKHVKFVGFVPNSKMPMHYNRCDIFCFPTLGEPFGKAVVEAMACGKPVIATNVGGTAEIIQNGANGILVPPANSEAIAAEIARLINDAQERRRIGKRARETAVERFSWEKIAEKYHHLYSELL
jgi:glycosyltransferase involved in cell wall biosynthesis